MWRAGPSQGPECSPGHVFPSKSNRIQESSNQAWPASDSHSVFYVRNRTESNTDSSWRVWVTQLLSVRLQPVYSSSTCDVQRSLQKVFLQPIYYTIGQDFIYLYTTFLKLAKIQTQRDFQNICSDQFQPVGYWQAQVRYSSSSRVSAAVSCTCLQYVREVCTVCFWHFAFIIVTLN